MRKLFLLTTFFTLTPIVLILSFLFLFLISNQNNNSVLTLGKTPKVAYAAVPKDNQVMLVAIEGKDARISAVRNFFAYYKSSLTPYAEEIVKAADKYGLDYALLPAIAMQESTLCKNAPKNSFNCWGFGIYGNKVTRFDNYKDAIDTVTKTLATKYKAQGLETPEEIMSKYNPVSTGTWAVGVSSYMERLRVDL